jgi:uncharacterized protein
MSSTDVVKSLYAAFDAGDMPKVLGLLDKQVLWREAEGCPYDSGDGWVGPDAVLTNLFAKIGEDWAEFKVRPAHFHEAGAVVTAEGRYLAKHKRTGRAMDCQFCHVWTVANGRVTKFQQYADTAKLQAMLRTA